jgi:hypothetical protein
MHGQEWHCNEGRCEICSAPRNQLQNGLNVDEHISVRIEERIFEGKLIPSGEVELVRRGEGIIEVCLQAVRAWSSAVIHECT